jgi:iron complex transport system ATP-binding protein
VHDLGLAARYCTRLVLLSGGRIMADGPPASVLGDDLMAQCFGIRGELKMIENKPLYQYIDVLSEIL